MEKYNSIGRVVEKSTEMQLEKWEEAIRVDERRKIYNNLVKISDDTYGVLSMVEVAKLLLICENNLEKYYQRALKGGEEEK